jgi:hypothetical protein
MPQLQKIILGLSPSGDGFCKLETVRNTKMAPRPKHFVLARRLQEYRKCNSVIL